MIPSYSLGIWLVLSSNKFCEVGTAFVIAFVFVFSPPVEVEGPVPEARPPMGKSSKREAVLKATG